MLLDLLSGSSLPPETRPETAAIEQKGQICRPCFYVVGLLRNPNPGPRCVPLWWERPVSKAPERRYQVLATLSPANGAPATDPANAHSGRPRGLGRLAKLAHSAQQGGTCGECSAMASAVVVNAQGAIEEPPVEQSAHHDDSREISSWPSWHDKGLQRNFLDPMYRNLLSDTKREGSNMRPQSGRHSPAPT